MGWHSSGVYWQGGSLSQAMCVYSCETGKTVISGLSLVRIASQW